MARRLHLLICLSLCAAGSFARAETPTPPPGTSPTKKADNAWKKGRKLSFDGTPTPEFDNVSRALNALTPAQRKRFEENFIRWANLAPDEKKALLDREQLRKRMMEKEVEMALQESGLQLAGERRQVFVQRYSEERRKIEEQLRKETNEKRKPLVRELIGRLQTEFSAAPVTAPAAVAPAQ